MKKFFDGCSRFVREEDAPTMAEYGFLLVFIALTVAAGASLLGDNLLALFNNSAGAVGPGVPTVPAAN